MTRLTHQDHARDRTGMTYVYPVLSRRAGGLSIGINLSPNNACNWACLYCQVPNLQRGASPKADTERLALELESLLMAHREGTLAERFELEGDARIIRDLALSGNGEPTSCPNLDEVMSLIEARFLDQLPTQAAKILITNGSLAHQPRVRRALEHWGRLGGEIWFKLDRGLAEGRLALNQARSTQDQIRRSLAACLDSAPTWIQTCLVRLDGEEPSADDWAAYFNLLEEFNKPMGRLKGVLYYGLARPSMQGAAERLGPIAASTIGDLLARTEALGLAVRHHP